MMDDLQELYREVILDHNKSPRNYEVLEDHNHFAEGDNPLCGDHIDVYLKVEGNTIKDIAFQGKGCAISKASASLMTSELKGRSLTETKELFEKFHKMVTSEIDETPDMDGLGKLAVLSGVKVFPLRIKCASLAWHTMNAALENNKELISTED